MTIIAQIMKLPTRVEPISGQNFSYVKLDDVLAIFEVDARDHAPCTLEPVVWQRRRRSDWRGWENISKEFYEQLAADLPEDHEIRQLCAVMHVPQRLSTMRTTPPELSGQGSETSETGENNSSGVWQFFMDGKWQDIKLAPTPQELLSYPERFRRIAPKSVEPKAWIHRKDGWAAALYFHPLTDAERSDGWTEKPLYVAPPAHSAAIAAEPVAPVAPKVSLLDDEVLIEWIAPGHHVVISIEEDNGVGYAYREGDQFFPGRFKLGTKAASEHIKALVALMPAAPTTSPEPDAVRDIEYILLGDEDFGVEHPDQGYMEKAAVRLATQIAALSRPAHGGWEEALQKIASADWNEIEWARQLAASALARNQGEGGGPRS